MSRATSLPAWANFDSKLGIEQHVRRLPITPTTVRPAAFMDMLVMPGFGLETGQFTFLSYAINRFSSSSWRISASS